MENYHKENQTTKNIYKYQQMLQSIEFFYLRINFYQKSFFLNETYGTFFWQIMILVYI